MSQCGERTSFNRTREAGNRDEVEGVVANTLNLFRGGAVGFIDCLDDSPPTRFSKRLFMIEPPVLFTGIQILPHVLINCIIAGFLVANVKICSTAIALTNADKFDGDIGMLPEKVSADDIIARWPRA